MMKATATSAKKLDVRLTGIVDATPRTPKQIRTHCEGKPLSGEIPREQRRA